MTIHHSENMAQKSDYQLSWIIANKATYSENQIKSALEEFKRREMVKTSTENINNTFRKLWDFVYGFFK